jgi:transposase
MIKTSRIRTAIRYSEAFKMEIVRELESGTINIDQIRRKYGVGSNGSIRGWVRKYGNGSVGRVIRVEKPQEINEREELTGRVRALEKALADANIDLVLERAYTRIACERAGIKDVEEFKKNNRGKQPS